MSELKQLQKKFNFKLTDEWTDKADFYMYSESTADGYEIYIATHDCTNINIPEDVYYYDSDLSDLLEDTIRGHFDKAFTDGTLDDKFPFVIYVDDIESHYVECAMDELREEWI